MSCLMHHSARSRARVGLLAGLVVGALFQAWPAPPDETASPGKAVAASADEELLLAATGLSSGNALRFVGLTTFGVDESANVDDLGPPRPAESSEPAGESISAADSTNADSAKAALDFEDADGAGHELWIVSTRNLPGNICSCPAAEFSPGVERFTCGHGWKRSSMEELLATDVPSRTTAILIHGNDTSANEAKARARVLSRTGDRLLRLGPDAADRLVVAQRQGHLLVSQRCAAQSVPHERRRLLSRPLRRSAHAETPVTIGGYSYGASVVTGGLHLLGGGVLEGRRLRARASGSTIDERPVDGGGDGQQLAAAGHASRSGHLASRSHDDPVQPEGFRTAFLSAAVGRARARGAGRDGPGGEPPGAEQVKIRQVNIQPQMHRRHGWDYFADSPAIMSLVRRELLSPPVVEAWRNDLQQRRMRVSRRKKGARAKIPLPVGEGRVRGVANAGRLDNWIAPRQGERDVRPPKRSAKSRRFLRLQLLVVAHQARRLVRAVHVGQGLLGAGVLLDIVILPFDRDRTAEAGAIQLDEERLR